MFRRRQELAHPPVGIGLHHQQAFAIFLWWQTCLVCLPLYLLARYLRRETVGVLRSNELALVSRKGRRERKISFSERRFDLLVKVFFVFKSIITKLGYKSTLRISPCSLNIQQIGRTMKLYETPLWKLSRLDVKASSSFFSSVFRSAKHRWERNNSRGRDENAH